jgi:hypothetical protein
MSLTKKEAAALERFEAERNRRIEDKIQSGAAIRESLVVVVGAGPADVVRARTHKRASLRRAGETREIYFDEMVIISGVPRAERDENYTRPAVSEPPSPPIFDRRSSPREPRVVDDITKKTDAPENPMHRIWAQTRPPSDGNPGGEIAEGWFKVEGGILHVEDMQGRLLGRQSVSRGENVEAIARKILREKTRNDFWAPSNITK